VCDVIPAGAALAGAGNWTQQARHGQENLVQLQALLTELVKLKLQIGACRITGPPLSAEG
jgi:hypothetical protein